MKYACGTNSIAEKGIMTKNRQTITNLAGDLEKWDSSVKTSIFEMEI